MLTVTEIFSPPDPHNLALRCLVNGESVQSSNTDQMVFKTEALVSWVSKYILRCAFFFPAHDGFVGGGRGLDSQRHFVFHERNFLYPSPETLDDATICGFKKICKSAMQIADVIFHKEHIVPANG